MIKIIILTCSIVLFILNTGYSQYRIKSSPEEMALARSYKTKFKTDEFLVTSSEVKFTFNRAKDINSKSPFSINENTAASIISLKEGVKTQYTNTCFYDNNSEVGKFIMYNKNDKKEDHGIVTSNQTYSSEGIFHDDTKLFIYSIQFDDIGQKINYTLTKTYNDPKYLTSVYFHSQYPTLEKNIILEIPEWAEIEIKVKNFENYSIQKTEEKNIKNKTTIYKYTLKNASADKSEIHQPGASFYLPHLILIHKGYTKSDGTKETIFRNTNDLYSWYSGLTNEVKNNKEILKNTVDKLIEGKTNDMDKIKAIFYWVQDNIRYIAFEDGIAAFKPDACQDVYTNKYGDCKGMANLLKNMLIIANYDARLTWVGTSHVAYDHSIPALMVDNHMICTLVLNGVNYFLDPTESYIGINDYAHRIQGREVLIENGKEYILDTIPEFPKERNTIRIDQKFSMENDLVKGSSRDVYNGEGRTTIIRSYNLMQTDKREEAIKKYLNDNDKNRIVSGISMTDMQDREKSLEFYYEIALKNQVNSIDKEKYINLDYEKEFKSFVFDTIREKDYIFDHKYHLLKTINLKIPEGYIVKHIPSNIDKSHNDFFIKISFVQKEDQIFYSKEIGFNNAMVQKKDFKLWNSYVKELRKIYNDQIIITKQ